jgi:cobalamin biosynthesis protein CobD/CbiB
MAGVMDRLINFIPAPMSALLIVVGTLFALTARPLAAFRGMFGAAAAGPLPREGWTRGRSRGLSACRCRVPGGWTALRRPARGSATAARANATDIARAMWLHLITGFLGLVPLVLLALIVHRF